MTIRKKYIVLLGVFILTTALPIKALSTVPEMIHYQGYLADSLGNPVDGEHIMVFSIYDVPGGGTALWSDMRTVSVTNGIYNVQIGGGAPMPLAADLFNGRRWLGVTVGSDTEMTPRQQLG